MVPQKKPRTFKEKLFANEPPDRQPPRITGGVRNAGYRILAQTATSSYSIPPAAFTSSTSPSTQAQARSAGSFSSSSSAGLPAAVRDLRNSHTTHNSNSSIVNDHDQEKVGSPASTIRASSSAFHFLPSFSHTSSNRKQHPGPLAVVPFSAANSTPLLSRPGPRRHRYSQVAEKEASATDNQPSTLANTQRSEQQTNDLIDAEDWGAPPEPRWKAQPAVADFTSRSSNTGAPSPPQKAHIWQDTRYTPSRRHPDDKHPTQYSSQRGPSTPSLSSLHTLGSTLTPPSIADRRAPWRTDRSSTSTASIESFPGLPSDITFSSQPPLLVPSEKPELTDEMVSPRTVDEVLMSLRGKIVDEQERGKGRHGSRTRDRDDDDDRDRYYSKGYDRLHGGCDSKLSYRRGRDRSIDRESERRDRYRDSSRERSRDRERGSGRERKRDKDIGREREGQDKESRRAVSLTALHVRKKLTYKRAQKDEEIDALQQQNATYKRDVDRLTARLDRVLAEREDYRATDNTITSDMRSMRKRNEKLEELLEDAQSKLTDLQRQVALSSPSPRRPSKEDKAALSALAEEVEVLRADKATLEFKLKSLSQVLEEEKAARKQSNTEAHAAKTQQSQIMQQRSELEARLQGIGKELASQQRARQLAIDRMREMEGLIGNLENFKHELTSAKKQNEELKQSLQVERNRVTYANDRYDGKQKQFEDQQDKVRQTRRENDALQAEKKEFEAKLAKYRDQSKYHSKAVDSLRECRLINDLMKRDQRDMKEKLADARSEITRLNRVLDDQERAAARLQEPRTSVQDRFASFDDDSDDTDASLPAVKPRVTAEDRFRSYRELGEKAPTRPRTAVPLGSTDVGGGSALPTLASSLNGSVLQVRSSYHEGIIVARADAEPDNKRGPTPFDPAPIDFEQHRPKSRMTSAGSTTCTRSATVQPKPPGGIDWRVITPARPKSAASSQASILDTDLRMSDSDSESKSQAPLASLSPVYENENERATDRTGGKVDITLKSRKGQSVLDGDDQPDPTPIRPVEATLGFETPAPLQASTALAGPDGSESKSRSSGSSGTMRGGTWQKTPLSGTSTATARRDAPGHGAGGGDRIHESDIKSRSTTGLDEQDVATRDRQSLPASQSTLSDVPSTTGSAGAKSTASASSDGAASTQTTKIRRIKDMLYDPFANIGDDFGLSLPKTSNTSPSADKASRETSDLIPATMRVDKQDHQVPPAPAPGRQAYDVAASPPTPCPSAAASQGFKTLVSSAKKGVDGALFASRSA